MSEGIVTSVDADPLGVVWSENVGLAPSVVIIDAIAWCDEFASEGMVSSLGLSNMTLSTAKFLTRGFALLSGLSELAASSVPNSVEVEFRVRASLSSFVVTVPTSVCGAVVKSTGSACKSSNLVSVDHTVCSRHSKQDLISMAMAALSSFPSFPVGQSLIMAGGGDCPPGPVAVCSLCLRTRMLSDVADECSDLGEPDNDPISFLSHWPRWMADAEALHLDRPGYQYCLHCASHYTMACTLLTWFQFSADAGAGVLELDSVLPSRQAWVWCPNPSMILPSGISVCQRFANSYAIAVPVIWSLTAGAATPGVARASVLRVAAAGRGKEGSGTANRAALADAVTRGQALAGRFEQAAAGEVIDLRANFNNAGDAGVQFLDRQRPQEPGVPASDTRWADLFTAMESGSTGAVMAEVEKMVEQRARTLAQYRPAVVQDFADSADSSKVARCADPNCFCDAYMGIEGNNCGHACKGGTPCKGRYHIYKPAAQQAGGGASKPVGSESVILDRLTQLEARLSGVQGMGFSVPLRPFATSPGDKDKDGFAAHELGNECSLFRCNAEDFCGVMLFPKAYSQRRTRLLGKPRIDVPLRRRLQPEEQSGDSHSFIIVGDTRIEGAPTKPGIPARGDYEAYASRRMMDLYGQLSKGQGVHARAHTGSAFAEFETRIILARYQLLQAVEHYLSDVREPRMPYGVVWRYMCSMVVNMWLDRDVTLVSYNMDIARYAMSAAVATLGLRSAPEDLNILASMSVDPDWLADAISAYEGSLPSSVAKGGAGDAVTTRCSVCGGLAATCGGYAAPGYKCSADIVVSCRERGCGVKHMLRGPRGWKCKGAAAAVSALTKAELRSAFGSSQDYFIAGKTSADAAKVAAVAALI